MAVESDTTEFDCPRRSNLSVPSLAGRAKVKGDASPQRASFETAESPIGDPKRVEGILSAAFTGLPQLTFDLEDTIKLPRVSDFSTETSSLATQKEPVIDEPKEADNHEASGPQEGLQEDEPKEADNHEASGPQEGLQEQDGEELEIDELEETECVNYQVGPIDTTLQDTIRLSLEAKDTMWPPSGRDGLVELAPTVEAVHTEASVNANCTSRQPIIAEDQSDSFAATLSADRRLFWILGACVFIQTVAELIIVVMFSLNKAYLALGVAALCAAPLTVFGMLASWNHGRFLGLYSGAMVVWQTWATLQVTLLMYRPHRLIPRRRFRDFLVDSFHSPDAELRGASILLIALYAVHLLMCVIAITTMLSWYLFPSQSRPRWELVRRNLGSPLAPSTKSGPEFSEKSFVEAKALAIKNLDVEKGPIQPLPTRIKAFMVRFKPSRLATLKRRHRNCTHTSQTSRASNGTDFFHTVNSGVSSLVPTRTSSRLSGSSSIEVQLGAPDGLPRPFGGSLPVNLQCPNNPTFAISDEVRTLGAGSERWSLNSGSNTRRSFPPSLVSDKDGASALPSPVSYTAGGRSSPRLQTPPTPHEAQPPLDPSIARSSTLQVVASAPKMVPSRSLTALEALSLPSIISPPLTCALRRHSVFSHLPAYLPSQPRSSPSKRGPVGKGRPLKSEVALRYHHSSLLT